MIRLLYRLVYFGRGALAGLRASPLTSAVAVATIAVTLLLGGAFALVLGNMQDLLERWASHLVVTAYLEEDLAAPALAALRERAGGLPGVESAALVSKREALARFESGVGARLGLAGLLEGNPLPASLELRLTPSARTGEGVRRVADALRALPGVAEIGAGEQWVEGYARALRAAQSAALGLGAVLTLATLLIVANTIRLAVFARRDEIEIQWLVGAGRVFIAVPFLLEGLLQGLLGGLLALGLLAALYAFALPGAGEGLGFVLGHARPRFLGGGELGCLLAAGAGLGGLGSAAALLQGWRR